ncbi:hypothetical protein ACHAXT_007397 [Thalassiosira profunda]
MSDDEDFEDLFSFGGTTPGAPASAEGAAAPSSTGSDFDLLSDVSLTSTPHDAAPAAGAAAPTPRSTAGDEFDALFGTPPATPATPRTPLDMSAAEKDALLSIDETPGGKLQSSHLDDFHVHDEETRDMLDWLDDDNAAKKAKEEPSDEFDLDVALGGGSADVPAAEGKEDGGFGEDDDDDFDFDSMLAEADSAPSPKVTAAKTEPVTEIKEESSPSTPPEEVKPHVVPPPEKPVTSTEDVAESPKSDEEIVADSTEPETSGDAAAPAPIPEPAPRPTIEDELAFDQWDEEELEDLQLADSGEASGDKPSEGDTDETSGDDKASSSAEKDGGSAVAKPPPPTKITFTSLSDAIRSNASTVDDIRSLFNKENSLEGSVGVNKEDRSHLWTKIICGKILGDIEEGSLADSYREWEKKSEMKFDGEEYDEMIDSLLSQSCGAGKEDDAYLTKKHQVLSLSHFHSQKNSTSQGIDPLIPPVALAILEAGVPPAAASVVLSHIEPSSMPILRLSHDERYLAAKALHTDFYLLACYHLPLLVMHLDRHCPGWYWPRKEKDDDEETASTKEGGKKATESGEGAQDEKTDGRSGAEPEPEKKKKSDLEQNGLIPLSWLVTNFAGECGGSCMDHKNLLPLWDNILTKADHSWKYFLAIATLEKNSDVLLMTKGDELKEGFKKILAFDEAEFTAESFVGASEGKSDTGGKGMVSEWLSLAKSLIEATPASAIDLLRSADDRAVASALKVRQTKMEEEIKAQHDAEEEARRKERDERDKEAEKALNKARLTAYYRQYNPEKVDTIDKILKLFDGRMGVLNEKLKKKYGKGFLPEEDLKDQTKSFFESVNKSISDTKKHVSVAAERRKKKPQPYEARPQTKVVLEVSTTEVIPVICTTKGHDLATGEKMVPKRQTSDTNAALEFYLVDCRPEAIAAEQGRFPTAVTLSPEKLQDPDELQKLTDMFESLRSAVHICVMGEGFASFPVLYHHKLSNAEQKLLEDDISRISNCALFFLKRGFPFVSILRGGFAAAHAFLSRNGDELGMSPPEVLVDYDPEVSLFHQLETARQEEERYKSAPAREKTAKMLQRIIDNSMTRLTIEEQRINSLAKPETVDKMKQSARNLLGKAKPTTVPSIGFGRTPPLFMSKSFPSATKADSETAKKPEVADASESSGGENDGKDKETAASSRPPPDSGEAPAKGESANETSKISGAFASLSQRMQQSALSPKAAAADSGDSTAEGESAAKESAGSKISFASFTNRLKKPSDESKNAAEDGATTGSSTEKETSEESGNNNAPKATSTFASLSQRIQQSAAASVARASDSGQPTTEGEPAQKEKLSFSFTKEKMSFSSFTKRAQPHISETAKAVEDKTLDEGSETTEDEPKPGVATSERLSGFTKSFGGSLSALKEKAAAVKEANGKKDTEKGNGETTSEEEQHPTTDEGRFANRSKSFGGLSARLKSKQESNTEPKKPEGEDSVVSSLEQSSLGFLLKDEPRPKTRFQRLEEPEESISFDDDTKPPTPDSQEGGLNDLFLGLDPEPHGDPTKDLFADVSLSDSGEDPPAVATGEETSNTANAEETPAVAAKEE